MFIICRCLIVVLAGGVLCLAATAVTYAGGMPDRVALDSLATLYEGVSFDHAMHVAMAEDCATCHHHTTGDAPRSPECARCHQPARAAGAVSCRGCHLAEPFSAQVLRAKDADADLYHRDKVGLKAAYHLSCMGCHREFGLSVDCQSCHSRSDAGDALFHSGEYAPAPVPGEGSHH